MLWVSQSSKKRNRKHSGDDSFDEGSVSESESESESGQAEEEKEEAGVFHFQSLPADSAGEGKGLVWRREMGEVGKEGGLLGETGGGRLCSFSVLHSLNDEFSLTPTARCIDETLKEKEKPKEEEREKPKDAPGLECKPRPLHKTCSLFMRNIAPNISRAEIISVSGGRDDRQALGGDRRDENLALLLMHTRPCFSNREVSFPWAHGLQRGWP